MIEDFFVEMTRKTPTYSKNTRKENIKTWSSGTTINGYIGTRVSLNIYEAGKHVTKEQYNFYSDTEFNFGDLLVYNSLNYRIESSAQDTINAGHHYKYMVERIYNID